MLWLQSVDTIDAGPRAPGRGFKRRQLDPVYFADAGTAIGRQVRIRARRDTDRRDTLISMSTSRVTIPRPLIFVQIG